LRHPLSLGAYQRAEKKVSTHHLPVREECLAQIGDLEAVFNKMVRFKKVDGQPGKFGAHRHNHFSDFNENHMHKHLFLMTLIL